MLKLGLHTLARHLALFAAIASLSGCVLNPFQPSVHRDMDDKQLADRLSVRFTPETSESVVLRRAKEAEMEPTTTEYLVTESTTKVLVPTPFDRPHPAPSPFVVTGESVAFECPFQTAESRRDYRLAERNKDLWLVAPYVPGRQSRLISFWFDKDSLLVGYKVWPTVQGEHQKEGLSGGQP